MNLILTIFITLSVSGLTQEHRNERPPGNPEIRNYCSEIGGESKKVSCRRTLRRNYYQSNALSLCEDEMFFDDDILDCAQAIVNKTYSREDLRACEDEFHDDDIIDCLEAEGFAYHGGIHRPYNITEIVSPPNLGCIESLPPVDHPDKLYSDGWLFSGYRNELNRCMRPRRRMTAGYDGICEDSYIDVIETDSYGMPIRNLSQECVDTLLTKFEDGNPSSQQHQAFREACQTQINICRPDLPDLDEDY